MQPHIIDSVTRLVPEAKDASLGDMRRRVDILVMNHGRVYILELCANMDEKGHEEHVMRAIDYAQRIGAWHGMDAEAVVLHFTTKQEAHERFPTVPQDHKLKKLSMLNIGVDLEDKDGYVFKICEPAALVDNAAAGLAGLNIKDKPAKNRVPAALVQHAPPAKHHTPAKSKGEGRGKSFSRLAAADLRRSGYHAIGIATGPRLRVASFGPNPSRYSLQSGRLRP
jgi:hypothetical protein